MAELDFIAQTPAGFVLDTAVLDGCFYNIGGAIKKPYRDFIIRESDGDRIDTATIRQAFREANQRRCASDNALKNAAEKYNVVRSSVLLADAAPRTFRVGNEIVPFRLVHGNTGCRYSVVGGAQPIPLYFESTEHRRAWVDLSRDSTNLTACPFCLENNGAYTDKIKYSVQNGAMERCDQVYPLNISDSRLRRMKRKQARERAKKVGGWKFGLVGLAILAALTVLFYWLALDKGFGQWLLDFQPKMVSRSIDFFPSLLDPDYVQIAPQITEDYAGDYSEFINPQTAAWLAMEFSSASMVGVTAFLLLLAALGGIGCVGLILDVILTVIIMAFSLAMPYVTMPLLLAIFCRGIGKKLCAILFPKTVSTDIYYKNTF